MMKQSRPRSLRPRSREAQFGKVWVREGRSFRCWEAVRLAASGPEGGRSEAARPWPAAPASWNHGYRGRGTLTARGRAREGRRVAAMATRANTGSRPGTAVPLRPTAVAFRWRSGRVMRPAPRNSTPWAGPRAGPRGACRPSGLGGVEADSEVFHNQADGHSVRLVAVGTQDPAAPGVVEQRGWASHSEYQVTMSMGWSLRAGGHEELSGTAGRSRCVAARGATAAPDLSLMDARPVPARQG